MSTDPMSRTEIRPASYFEPVKQSAGELKE